MRIGPNGTPSTPQTGDDAQVPAPAERPRLAGLEHAAGLGQTPTAAGRLPAMALGGAALAQGVSQVAARGVDLSAGPKMFAFVQQNAPGSVGFVETLKAIGQRPEAAALVQGLVADVEARTGMTVPPEVVQAALHKPELITNVMALSAGQMKAGFTALHRTPAREAMGEAVKKRQLPKTFDFAKMDEVQVELPPEKDLAEFAPGLYRGSMRDPKVSDAEAKSRIVLAEVMDRLSDNANIDPKDRFSVKYEGGEYTRLESFLEALADHGHVIEARVDHRVADFLDLKAQTPDGIKSVAAPVMVRTGVEDMQGHEAVIPAVHSEIVYTVRPGPETRGQKVGGEVKWYQGVPNTGFFASGINAKGDWTGTITTQRFEGADARKAAKFSGLFGDVINDAAKKAERPMAGYGDTGVCIDSVATVVRLMNETVTAFPLLQGDALLAKELEGRIAHGNPQDGPEYRALMKAVEEVPSDARGPVARRPGVPSTKARALTSMPWEAGKEPFVSSMQARQILA